MKDIGDIKKSEKEASLVIHLPAFSTFTSYQPDGNVVLKSCAMPGNFPPNYFLIRSECVQQSRWIVNRMWQMTKRGYIEVPDFCGCPHTSRGVLRWIYEYLSTKRFERCPVWGVASTFKELVHMYYVGEFFGIDAIKDEVAGELERVSELIASCQGDFVSEKLSSTHVHYYLTTMAAFTLLKGYRPRLQLVEAFCRAGERLQLKLRADDVFCRYLNTVDGRDFAYAIGMGPLIESLLKAGNAANFKFSDAKCWDEGRLAEGSGLQYRIKCTKASEQAQD